MKDSNNERAAVYGKTLTAELDEKIVRYARVSHYVLITGERGTGKTTIAKKLHEQSARAKKEFVNLNCASLTPELLEAELFGYEKGAFTGATAPKIGLFEAALGGTIFLDEIGELPVGLQAKLLKAVEEKRIRRVGSNSERTIEARIVAATSQNLKKMVEGGRFRADLYDRLNILNLETIPLRFQKEKIETLLRERLNAEQCAAGRAGAFEISADAIRLLENYDWRGNFRELINFTTRLAVECLDEVIITAEAVERILRREKSNYFDDFSTAGSLITVTFDSQSDDLDSIYLKAAGNVIRHVLSEHNGNFRSAANQMGANHSTLSRILKKFNQSCEEKRFHPPRNITGGRAASAATA